MRPAVISPGKVTKIQVWSILESVKRCFTTVRTQKHVDWLHQCGLQHPVNPASPAGLRGRSHQPPRWRHVEPDASRGACPVRGRLLQAKLTLSQSAVSIPCKWLNLGDRDTLDLWSSRGARMGDAGLCRLIPPGGSERRMPSVRSTLAAVGSLYAAMHATGPTTRLGAGLKRPAANSSTMKGA